MELETTRIFVKVVQQESFSRAAALLKMPVSSVSRAVSRLEAEIGATLLQRTTRSLKLTAAGKMYFEGCIGPIQSLEEARRSLQDADSIMSGRVKITAPEDLGEYAVTHVLAQLLRKHPTLSFEFNFTDEIIDLVEGGYDLAVRLGRLNASRFKVLRVGEVAMIPVASPEYLATISKIRAPKDLRQQEILCFSGTAVGNQRVRATGNQMGSLISMATAGAGIAMVPHYTCHREIELGKLVRLLPGWTSSRFAASLVIASSTRVPARVRLVADELAVALKKILR